MGTLLMLDTPTILDVHQRITLFFKELKLSDVRFNNAKDAHAYLKHCLARIESEHGWDTANTMSMPSFSNFWVNDALHLHYGSSYNQTILIHENGAFGIYQNTEDHHMDFEFYKQGSTMIVEKLNSYGLSLWG